MNSHLQLVVIFSEDNMKKYFHSFILNLFVVLLSLVLFGCNQPSNTPVVFPTQIPTPTPGNEDIANSDKERLYNEVILLINNKTFKESQYYGYKQNETIEWLDTSNTISVNNSIFSVNIGSYTKSFSFNLSDIKTITRETYGTKTYVVTMNNTIVLKVDPCYYTGLVYWDAEANNLFKYFTISPNTNTTTTTNPPVSQTSDLNGTWYLNKNMSSQQNVIFNSGTITVTANTGSGNQRNATYTVSGNTITITYTANSYTLTGVYSFNISNNQLTLTGTENDYAAVSSVLFQSTNLVFSK